MVRFALNPKCFCIMLVTTFYNNEPELTESFLTLSILLPTLFWFHSQLHGS